MESRVDVDEVSLRAARYWMEDGLVELMFGLMMLLAFGVPLAARALTKGSLENFMSPFGNQAISVASIYSTTWGLKKLKERITYPRCGYVAFPQPTRKRRTVVMVFALLIVVAMALATLLLADYGVWLSRILVPAIAAAFAACLLAGGLQYKQPTMLWEALLALLFATILGLFTNLRGEQGFEALTTMVGVSMAIIGVFRLRSFLKANPSRPETDA